MPTRIALLIVGMISKWASCAHGKHFAVTGGMMKSHHLTVVPMIEGLLERGHKVSFLMPATTEAKTYFPQGVGNASMVYLGTEDWSFDSLFAGDDMDLKNQPWYKKLMTFVTVLSSYRTVLDKPIFSMHEELVEWIKQPGIDAFLLHGASFGATPVVEKSGIPFITFLAFPPIPFFFVHDSGVTCRYPNMLNPPLVETLKSSIVARISNQMVCRFLQGYMMIANHEFRAIFEKRDLTMPRGDMLRMISGSPHGIVLGGPPLSDKLPLSPGIHLVGSVERPKPRTIPSDMLAWLDAGENAGAPIMYISLGTKYEFTQTTCTQLVALLHELTVKFGLRVLWSLRASQQEKLSSLLPKQDASIRIEKFTPQPEVLQHAGVKVFLSHCGWGGVTDTIGAGVPVLAFPGMSDQFQNAKGLEKAGAGILLNGDFSNLVESTKLLLTDSKYADASKAAGEALRSYGGLDRALEIMEAAANGQYLTPDPKVSAMMNDVDPFFQTPQVLEYWICMGLLSTLLLTMLLMMLCCCRFFSRYCCGRGKANVEAAKKKQ